jgi:hypothetical protein
MYVTESDLQKNVVKWLSIALPPNSVFHHSPNEGYKNKVQYYVKQKGMGFKAGWPDLEIFVPNSVAIFIELKQPGNYATPRQREIHKMLQNAGAICFVARSIQDVWVGLKDRIQLSKHPYVRGMVLQEETLGSDLRKLRKKKLEMRKGI